MMHEWINAVEDLGNENAVEDYEHNSSPVYVDTTSPDDYEIKNKKRMRQGGLLVVCLKWQLRYRNPNTRGRQKTLSSTIAVN